MPIVQPFLSFLGPLVGHKWLWGKDEERKDNLSISPEILRSGVELRETKIENSKNLENRDCASTVNGSSEGSEMQTSNNVYKNPPIVNEAISVQCDFIPKSPTPEEELSEVMEMVATLYEQGLVKEKEKNDFFQKLSELQREELFDPTVLSGMKRKLRIVPENGLRISSVDDYISSIVVHKPSHDIFTDVRKSENHSITPNTTDHISSTRRLRGTETGNLGSPHSGSFNFSQIEEKDPVTSQENTTQKEQSNVQNDNLITIGIAALGIVASGIVVTMGGNDQTPDDDKHSSIDTVENANRKNEEDSKRNTSSTVEIVELTDHNAEDDWVAIVQ